MRRSCADCSLAQLCLPAGIDRNDLGRLDTLVQKRRPLRRGDHLFRAGDGLGSVFVASEGTFKTVVINESGEEHVLGFHLRASCSAWTRWAPGGIAARRSRWRTPRSAELPFSSLATVAAQLPSLQRQLLRVMGQSSDRDHDLVDVLSRRQASERIALFLLGLRDRYRRIGQSGEDVHLPMSRGEIGRHLGLALETVSRGFSRLHEDGVIDVRGRHVRVLDEAALRTAARGCEAGRTRPRGHRQRA